MHLLPGCGQATYSTVAGTLGNSRGHTLLRIRIHFDRNRECFCTRARAKSAASLTAKSVSSCGCSSSTAAPLPPSPEATTADVGSSPNAAISCWAARCRASFSSFFRVAYVAAVWGAASKTLTGSRTISPGYRSRSFVVKAIFPVGWSKRKIAAVAYCF